MASSFSTKIKWQTFIVFFDIVISRFFQFVFFRTTIAKKLSA